MQKVVGSSPIIRSQEAPETGLFSFPASGLADGTAIELSRDEAREVYERLWSLVPARGALTAAGKFRDAFDFTAFPNPNVALDAWESAPISAVYAAGGTPGAIRTNHSA